jgi:adenylate kinase family enzyme
MNPVSFIFLIGKPGSGKTISAEILIDFFKKRAPDTPVVNIDDFCRLKAALKKDRQFLRHRRGAEGGFEILDQSIYDEVLVGINDVIKNQYMNGGQLILIQFARTSYERAFQLFGREIINKSVIIYLDCDLEICWARNLLRMDRHDSKQHYVPKAVMERDYAGDDLVKLQQSTIGNRIVVIKNESSNSCELDDKLLAAMSKFSFCLG